MYLFRISVKPTDVWSKFYSKRNSLKPLYVIAETKDAAMRYANAHMRLGLTIKSISKLAEQLGYCMFSGMMSNP